MKSTSSLIIRLAPGVLALALLAAPPPSRADEAPRGKLSKARQQYDADGDGRLDDAELAAAKEGAKAKAKQTREENLRKALAKYDANANGRLDEAEMARKKADEQAEKEEKRIEREARKAEKEAKKSGKK